MIKAECQWPADDIVVSLNGHPLLMGEEPTDKNRAVHGYIRKGWIGLSVHEADMLVLQLNSAIKEATNLDEAYVKVMQNGEKLIGCTI